MKNGDVINVDRTYMLIDRDGRRVGGHDPLVSIEAARRFADNCIEAADWIVEVMTIRSIVSATTRSSTAKVPPCS